jgi:hypothetical protein
VIRLKVRLSTIDRMQNGPSYSSSAAMSPEKSASAQSRCSPSRRRAPFFPPGLDPVLDRGVGDEDAMIAPEAPAGGLVGQAIFDDQANSHGDDPLGVMAAGCGQVGGVGVEGLAALGAVVLRVSQDEIARPAGAEVAEVVECASEDPIAVSTMATTRARTSPEVAAALTDLRRGQILDAGDPLGGVGPVFSGPWQG